MRRGDQAFELVDGRLRVADLDGVELAHREGEEGAAVEGVAVELVARGRGDVDAEEVLERYDPVLGDVGVVDDDAVRAAALEADQVAPVVEHAEVLAGDDEDDEPVGLARGCDADVVRRVRGARSRSARCRARGSRRGSGFASASWKAKLAGETKCPSPKISACASSGQQEPICSAWPEPSVSIQPVDGQPREIDIITR